MLKKLFCLILATCLCTAVMTVNTSKVEAAGTTYYISFSDSNASDNNAGTSQTAPWKNITKISSRTFSPGDQILLKAGDTWNNQTITLNGNGTASSPITISMYGTGSRPKISPDTVDAICIYGSGIAGWKILNLELCNAKEGIDLRYDHDYNNDYIWIENIYCHDMNHAYNSKDYEDITQAERDAYVDHGNQGGGIYIRSQTDVGQKMHFNQPVVLTNLTIKNCDFYNCDVAVWPGATLNGAFQPAGKDYGRINGLTMQNCTARYCGMWGFQVNFTDNATVSGCTTDHVGFVSNRFGSCSLLLAYSNYVTFDNCTVANQHRHPDQSWDAAGFDFEGGTDHCSLINSTFTGIDGYAIMTTVNCDNPNYNVLIDNNVVTDYSRNYPIAAPAVQWFVKEGVPNATGTISNNQFICYKEGLPKYDYGVVGTGYTGNPYSSFVFSNNTQITQKPITLGKTVTTSSQSAGYEASKAVDGDTATFWCTNELSYPAWIQIDLGQRFTIDTLHQQFNNFSTWKYWIAVSDDPTFATYSTIVDHTAGSTAAVTGTHFTDKATGTNKTGRYIRLTVNEGGGHWATSREFKVYGTPVTAPGLISQGRTASASNQQAGYEASKAVDGNTATYWCTSGNIYPAWLKIDLGSIKNITRFDQLFAIGSPWKYKIEVSDNDSTYTTVVDRTDGQTGTQFSDDVCTKGRYVRLYLTDGGGNWANSKEFRVYGY